MDGTWVSRQSVNWFKGGRGSRVDGMLRWGILVVWEEQLLDVRHWEWRVEGGQRWDIGTDWTGCVGWTT